MTKSITSVFQSEILLLPLVSIIPVKAINPIIRTSKKYQHSSISA